MFGKNHYVPSKISIGGEKARRFLFAPIGQCSSGKWELWKYLCAENTSQTSNGSKAQEFKDVWIYLDEMVMIIWQSDLDHNDHNEFQRACMAFSRGFVRAFSMCEANFTHYMVQTF